MAISTRFPFDFHSIPSHFIVVFLCLSRPSHGVGQGDTAGGRGGHRRRHVAGTSAPSRCPRLARQLVLEQNLRKTLQKRAKALPFQAIFQ